MAFIAGIVNPKRIDYNYAGEAAKKEEAASAAVVDNGAEAVADGKEQTGEEKLMVEADGKSGSDVGETMEQVKVEEAPTGSEEASAGVSDAEADTPIKRGRKPSKKA